MNIQVPTSITIDGVEHPVANFSEGVQRLVTIHTEWRTDLAKERLAVAKTEAAIRGLDVELSQLVASELAKSADTAVLPVTDDLTGGNAEAPSASVE